jgi:hypothetical protein
MIPSNFLSAINLVSSLIVALNLLLLLLTAVKNPGRFPGR